MSATEIQQTVYDRVMNHLRLQGHLAMEDAKCRYRAPDGSRCAIGALIPDENYCKQFEGNSVSVNDVFDALPEDVQSAGIDFLMTLQGRLHDLLSNDGYLTKLERAAKDVCFLWGLVYTPRVSTDSSDDR